ncbi:MFS transporter [Auritidibacter ignavus]|uniref:MFS transporter n=1 Tax=Auritidibacter ignavus TaxID=678932 RepID=UPI00109CEEF8|nr:MFS transporter [Auritidibacter ignavus]
MTSTQKQLLAVVMVPMFMSLLAVSSINVVLPSLSTTLDATTSQIQWVLSGYTLAFGITLVAGGRAGDIYGRGKLFVAGVFLFGVGSLLSALAPTGLVLDAARMLTGIGSGLLNPQTMGFIQQYFRGQQRARAFAISGSLISVSVAIGPLLGGTLISLAGPEWGWRWTFLVNVPIAIFAVIFARWWFPASAWQRPGSTADVAPRAHPDLDPVGMITLAVAVMLIMLAFIELTEGWWVVLILVAGLLAFIGWLGWEHHYRRAGHDPMVNLDLFRIRGYRNGALLIGLYFTGSTSIFVSVAMYLQAGMGFSALAASLIGLPSALIGAFSAQLGGKLVLNVGRKLVAIGMGIVMVSMALTAGVVAGHLVWGLSPWWMMLALTISGMGQGLVVSPNQTLTLMDVPVQNSGAAAGVMQTGQRIGTAMGTALITTILFELSSAANWDVAFMTALAVIVFCMAGASVVALLDHRRALQERAPAHDSPSPR